MHVSKAMLRLFLKGIEKLFYPDFFQMHTLGLKDADPHLS